MASTPPTSQSIIVVHPIMLLAQPVLGTTVLGFLASGTCLASHGFANGFFIVYDDQGRPGYVPMAVCEPLAVSAPNDIHPEVRLIQPVTPYTNPSPGTQAGQNWIIPVEEPVEIVEHTGRFLKVQRQNGQLGYVPALICKKPIPSSGRVALLQPVALYHSPTPGGQFVQLLVPEEPLFVLGKDARFVLVQREDGRLSYVPAPLCGQASTETIFKVGRIDLGWIILGGGWTFFNWGALAELLRQTNLVDPFWKPYLALGILLGTAATLWLGSPRRLQACSFALGLLLCYAFLHLISAGRFTLWP